MTSHNPRCDAKLSKPHFQKVNLLLKPKDPLHDIPHLQVAPNSQSAWVESHIITWRWTFSVKTKSPLHDILHTLKHETLQLQCRNSVNKHLLPELCDAAGLVISRCRRSGWAWNGEQDCETWSHNLWIRSPTPCPGTWIACFSHALKQMMHNMWPEYGRVSNWTCVLLVLSS